MNLADWMIATILGSMAFAVAWYYGPEVWGWLKRLWRR